MTTAGVLFCGAGLASLGLERAGLDVRWAIDLDPARVRTHGLNLPGCRGTVADVSEVHGEDLPPVDLVWGSPPCKKFSPAAGLRRDPAEGLVLVREFERVVRELRPRWWVGENVLGFLWAYPDRVRAAPAWCVLDAADFGVPQHRTRVFWGAFRAPRPTHAPRAQETLDGRVLRPYVTIARALRIRPGDNGHAAPSGQFQYPLPSGTRLTWSNLVRAHGYHVDKPERVTGAAGPYDPWVFLPDRPAATICSNDVRAIVLRMPGPVPTYRFLTAADRQALMGVPPSFRFPPGTGEMRRWNMLGDGVCPAVSEAIARATCGVDA